MKYYIDQKVTVWRRTFFDCTEKEALEEFSFDGTLECVNSEILFNTEEYIGLSENCGEATRELYNEKGKLIKNNVNE